VGSLISVRFERIFQNRSPFGKVMGKSYGGKVDHFKRPVRRGIVLLKGEELV